MKKLSILLLSALALGITTTSCTKDKEEAVATASIVAKWNFDKLSHTSAGVTSAETPYNDGTCTDLNYLDLKAAGILEQQAIGDETDPCAIHKMAGTYTYQGDVLHIAQESNELDLTVVSLTSSKLVIKMSNPADATDYYTFTLVK